MPGISQAVREASQEAIEIVESWRPVFLLLVHSPKFRGALVDAVKILRRAFLRHQEGIGELVEKKFVAGENPTDIAKDATEKAKESFQTPTGETTVKITDEEWDKLHEDISRVLTTLNKQSEFRNGIEKLFRLSDIMLNQVRRASPNKESLSQLHAQRVKTETQELIATFAGRENLDRFIESLQDLMQKLDKDPKIRSYFKELREFILKGDTSTEEFKRHSRELTHRGSDLMEEFRNSKELNEFINASDDLLDNIKNDEFVTGLRKTAGIVQSDLSYVDTDGKLQFDLQLVGKLQSAIAPILAENLKYIPVPRIEEHNDSNDYTIDDIILCGYDIIPENIGFRIESDSEVGIREIETKFSKTRLVINLKNIRTEVKDMKFAFNKKTFPPMSDSGIVTLRIGGEGANLKLIFVVKQGSDDKVPTFTDGEAHFHIPALDVEFKETHHTILLPLFTYLFKLRIQSNLEAQVEEVLKGYLQTFGTRITDTLMQINRPFMSTLEQARDIVKSTPIHQTYQKRQEVLE